MDFTLQFVNVMYHNDLRVFFKWHYLKDSFIPWNKPTWSWYQFSSVQSLSHVQLFVIPWIAARQALLSITNFQSSLKLTSIELVMPSSHLILCRPLFLLPPIPPKIRVLSNESTLHMRWPKYWSLSFSIIPSKEYPGLISFNYGKILYVCMYCILYMISSDFRGDLIQLSSHFTVGKKSLKAPSSLLIPSPLSFNPRTFNLMCLQDWEERPREFVTAVNSPWWGPSAAVKLRSSQPLSSSSHHSEGCSQPLPASLLWGFTETSDCKASMPQTTPIFLPNLHLLFCFVVIIVHVY